MWKTVIYKETEFSAYEVHRDGRIRNKASGRQLKTQLNQNGYPSVHLRIWNTSTLATVHSIVAETHIPNPLKSPFINHKDENKTNPHADNLEWCTPKYNAGYGKGRLSSAKPVLQYTKDGKFVQEHESLRAASLAVCGHDRGGYRISAVIGTPRPYAYKFLWKWK